MPGSKRQRSRSSPVTVSHAMRYASARSYSPFGNRAWQAANSVTPSAANASARVDDWFLTGHGAILRREGSPLRRSIAPFGRDPRGIACECQGLPHEAQKNGPGGKEPSAGPGRAFSDEERPSGSIATSTRRRTTGKGRSSGTFEAHGRYLSSEPRADATEERDYACAWSRWRDGQWPSSSAPSRRSGAWSRRTRPKVGSKASKSRSIRMENGPGPTESRSSPTKNRAIPMHGRAGATNGRGQWDQMSRGCSCMVAMARWKMGILPPDGSVIRMHGWGSRFDDPCWRRKSSRSRVKDRRLNTRRRLSRPARRQPRRRPGP